MWLCDIQWHVPQSLEAWHRECHGVRAVCLRAVWHGYLRRYLGAKRLYRTNRWAVLIRGEIAWWRYVRLLSLWNPHMTGKSRRAGCVQATEVMTVCEDLCFVNDWQLLIKGTPWNNKNWYIPKCSQLISLFKGFQAKRQIASLQAKILHLRLIIRRRFIHLMIGGCWWLEMPALKTLSTFAFSSEWRWK